MNREELRLEFYKVMEYSEPFGNEYHDELFNWFYSKLTSQRSELLKELRGKIDAEKIILKAGIPNAQDCIELSVYNKILSLLEQPKQ